MKDIDQILKEIDGLITLPEVYLNFRKLMDDPSASNEQFAQLVSCDPNLSAVLLKIINSPLYGLSEDVDSINKAIHYLGIQQVHDLVIATSAVGLNFPGDVVPLIIFWRSSLLSGILARSLANLLELPNSESLFLIGLLHQIGQLIIYSLYPDKSKKLIVEAKESFIPIDKLELNNFGFHYGQVGAKLMAQWNLPVKFQVITYFHPTPEEAPIHQLEATLIKLVHLYAVNRFSDDDNHFTFEIPQDIEEYLKIQPEEFNEVVENALKLFKEMESAILSLSIKPV